MGSGRESLGRQGRLISSLSTRSPATAGGHLKAAVSPARDNGSDAPDDFLAGFFAAPQHVQERDGALAQ
jgi:hypothetical protein